VHANVFGNEKPANPILNPLYKKLKGTNERKESPNYKFLGGEPRSWQPICFYDSNDQVGKSRTRSLCAMKEEKIRKCPTLETPDKMSIQSMPSRFERQMKSVDSLMQRPKDKKIRK